MRFQRLCLWHVISCRDEIGLLHVHLRLVAKLRESTRHRHWRGSRGRGLYRHAIRLRTNTLSSLMHILLHLVLLSVLFELFLIECSWQVKLLLFFLFFIWILGLWLLTFKLSRLRLSLYRFVWLCLHLLGIL